ncbi:exported hypothetical protein [Bradyrhizobium sp. ORS 375]|nr:exported hypothetical protein [Bradyrhizobium sp. ORS 375]
MRPSREATRMKRLACAALLALLTVPAGATEAQRICVWGKPADLLSRMPAGRAGYDALLVRRPNEQEPFFVMLKRGLPLSAACKV